MPGLENCEDKGNDAVTKKAEEFGIFQTDYSCVKAKRDGACSLGDVAKDLCPKTCELYRQMRARTRASTHAHKHTHAHTHLKVQTAASMDLVPHFWPFLPGFAERLRWPHKMR